MLLLLSFILIVWKDKIFKEKISSSTRAILWIRVLKLLLLCIRDHSSRCLKSLTNIKEMHYYSSFLQKETTLRDKFGEKSRCFYPKLN